jgi:hypothetical protein
MVDLYKRCGEILHTTNPYKPALDYGPFGSEISGWLSKVIALLEKHKVRLLGTKSTILVQMGAYGQPVTCTTFIHCPPELKTKIDAANGKK